MGLSLSSELKFPNHDLVLTGASVTGTSAVRGHSNAEPVQQGLGVRGDNVLIQLVRRP